MGLTGTSLNAVTTTGPGSALTFDEPRTPVGIQLSVTGAGVDTFIVCDLEGSLDGVNWSSLATVNGVGGTAVSAFPALAIRANWKSVSGTVPTLTALVVGAP